MKGRLFTIVLLLCAFVLNASSQKDATVKSFVQTTDHISGSDRRNDMNGMPCALVKVQVVDDISRVEGNRIGDIVTKGVEKWVYMCKGSRNMKIHLKNHLPVRIMFQDYQINGLESNRVYELVIETPDAPAQLDKKQKLVINYTPANAMVLIDSKPYRGNGCIETELPVGDHRYIIAADGYITAEGVIKLNEQGAREITEKLIVESTTPVQVTLNEGYYAIGTAKDLKDVGLLSSGFHKKKVNYENFNQDIFQKVNIRNTTQLIIPSKIIKILTTIPSESYTLSRDGNSTVLTINDVDRFWSLSKYLVIQIY